MVGRAGIAPAAARTQGTGPYPAGRSCRRLPGRARGSGRRSTTAGWATVAGPCSWADQNNYSCDSSWKIDAPTAVFVGGQTTMQQKWRWRRCAVGLVGQAASVREMIVGTSCKTRSQSPCASSERQRERSPRTAFWAMESSSCPMRGSAYGYPYPGSCGRSWRTTAWQIFDPSGRRAGGAQIDAPLVFAAPSPAVGEERVY